MNWLLPPLEPHFDAALRDVRARMVESRVAAAERLARPAEGRQQEAETGLLTLLDDRAPGVRVAALRSLSEIGTDAICARVRRCLEDPDPLVREMAVVALASIPHAERQDTLLGALEHAAPEVRFQALSACAELCPQAATPAMLRLSRDQDPRLREASARALGQLNRDDGRFATRLHVLLEDPAQSVRLAAALALADEAPEAAIGILIAALEQPEARIEALEALGHFHNPTAEAAVYALGRRVLISPIVNAACGRTLVRMGARQRGVACLRDALGALRGDGRDLALETIAAHRLTELGPELLRLSRRRRGADLERLARASAEIAAESKPAKQALGRLANREDDAGRLARTLLHALSSPESH